MNIYLNNILWAFTTGYVLYGILFGLLVWGFWTVITVKMVEDTQYVDIVDDILTPLFVGLLVAIIVTFCWGLVVPFALLFGINLLIFEFIMRVIVPFYRFIKDLPIMDRRKGEDI